MSPRAPHRCQGGALRLWVGSLAAAALLLWAIPAAATPGAQLGPRRLAQPVVVELGGWQITAQRAQVVGALPRFREVHARRVDARAHDAWVMASDRLDVVVDPIGGDEPRWMWASGHVRLSGPRDL